MTNENAEVQQNITEEQFKEFVRAVVNAIVALNNKFTEDVETKAVMDDGEVTISIEPICIHQVGLEGLCKQLMNIIGEEMPIVEESTIEEE